MGHKQLRIGVQGWRVEHRGERRVRVVQKEDTDGGGGRQKKTQKAGRKKKNFFGVSDPHEN